MTKLSRDDEIFIAEQLLARAARHEKNLRNATSKGKDPLLVRAISDRKARCEVLARALKGEPSPATVSGNADG